jgi:hypothetical protein
MVKAFFGLTCVALAFFLLLGGRVTAVHDSCDIESVFPPASIRTDEQIKYFLVRVVTVPVRRSDVQVHQALLQHLSIEPSACKHWRSKMLGGGAWAVLLILILASISVLNYGPRLAMTDHQVRADDVRINPSPNVSRGFVMIDPTFPLTVLAILEIGAILT